MIAGIKERVVLCGDESGTLHYTLVESQLEQQTANSTRINPSTVNKQAVELRTTISLKTMGETNTIPLTVEFTFVPPRIRTQNQH